MTLLSPLAAKGVSDRVSEILGQLRQHVANRLAPRRDLQPLVLLLWGTMARAMRRFARYAEWAATGRPPPKPKRVPREPDPTTPSQPSKPRRRLSRRWAWLNAQAPGAGNFGSQLQHMIDTDPEMQALLMAVPEARTMLQPILRILGVGPGPDHRRLEARHRRAMARAAGTLPPPKPRQPRAPRPRPASWEPRLSDRALRKLIAPSPGMPDPLGVRFNGR